MLQRMMIAKTQTVLFLLSFALLGTGVANAQSRLEAARAKERELNQAAERVDTDSRDADRIYREAANATREREQIEREERQRSEGSRSALDIARDKERTLNEAAQRVDPDSRDADRIYRDAAGATRERERIEREDNQRSENNRSALNIAREREQELNAAAQRVNPNSRDADRIYRAAASATHERQRLERQETQSTGPTSRIEGSYVLQEGNGYLVLRNGDVIQLPSRQYWEPGAKVTVSRISGPQLHYQVTIVNGRNEQQVEKYVDAAHQTADYVSDLIDAVLDPSPYHKFKVAIDTMRPILTPVPLNEGETQWAYTYSRFRGLVTVQMIYLR